MMKRINSRLKLKIKSRGNSILKKNQKNDEKITKIDVKVEIRKLLKRGREQGFIAQEEVLAIFPTPEDSIFEIDELYHKFLDEGIDVFDTTEIDTEDATKSVS